LALNCKHCVFVYVLLFLIIVPKGRVDFNLSYFVQVLEIKDLKKKSLVEPLIKFYTEEVAQNRLVVAGILCTIN
jgi:hypothetical protein